MNRNNFWVHISFAVILVALAAVIGQIDRWRAALRTAPPATSCPIKSIPKTVPAVPQTRPPELLVRFKQGVSLDEIRRVAVAHNDQLEDEIESVKGLSVIDDLDNRDPNELAAQYGSMKDIVDYAEVNSQVSFDDPVPAEFTAQYIDHPVPGLPDDPQFADQWALDNQGQENGTAGADIHALEAWKKTHGSEEVVVAVLDSGVDYTHLDLRSNMWLRPDNVPAYFDDELGSFNDQQGYNGTDPLTDPMDDNGHGTHCAGIIGAEGDNSEGIAGINWHVQIMPLKFLGRGGFGTTADAIKAINYAIDRKKHGVNIRVINASWGSTQNSKALKDAIAAAGDAGILFVAAAGNDGSDNDRRPHFPSNYDLPNVISVAALDRNDQLATFSNWGLKSVHVAAPGKDILSTWLGDAYRDASGTSMAAPQVSGVAALILAKEPNLSVESLKERILKSVDKLDGLNGKVASGGRIDAAKAVGN